MKAEYNTICMKIDETEEYVGLLREIQANARMKMRKGQLGIKAAHRAIPFTRSVLLTLKAEDHSTSMKINETEEYLGVLRGKQVVVEMRMREADEQIGVVRDALRRAGIQELSLFDDEDLSSEGSEQFLFSDQVIPPTSSYKMQDSNSSDGPSTLSHPAESHRFSSVE